MHDLSCLITRNRPSSRRYRGVWPQLRSDRKLWRRSSGIEHFSWIQYSMLTAPPDEARRPRVHGWDNVKATHLSEALSRLSAIVFSDPQVLTGGRLGISGLP
jgi:hypothetical protein